VADPRACGTDPRWPDVEGWTLEADEDGVVELFHESDPFPKLSNASSLGAVLAFIADQPNNLTERTTT